MTAPRIEIDLRKIRNNARFLVDRLALDGIRIAGVTKAVCGDPVVALAMVQGGVSGLADARLSNVKRMRDAGITSPIVMIRSPMSSEVGDIVRNCSASYNTGINVVAELSAAALGAGKVHDIILMVEMGDMRDGIVPEDVSRMASRVIDMPGVALRGIAANFACLGNVAPDAKAIADLSKLASGIEGTCGPYLEIVSGGGSANLPWALASGARGRVNELRLGEAILLGTEPVTGTPISGLHTDAFTFVAEVIETKSCHKPISLHLVEPAVSAVRLVKSSLEKSRVVLATGRQDIEIRGLIFPPHVTLIGATSDHTVIEVGEAVLQVGEEIRCRVSYGALMRAMNARDVERVYVNAAASQGEIAAPQGRALLSSV